MVFVMILLLCGHIWHLYIFSLLTCQGLVWLASGIDAEVGTNRVSPGHAAVAIALSWQEAVAAGVREMT